MAVVDTHWGYRLVIDFAVNNEVAAAAAAAGVARSQTQQRRCLHVPGRQEVPPYYLCLGDALT